VSWDAAGKAGSFEDLCAHPDEAEAKAGIYLSEPAEYVGLSMFSSLTGSKKARKARA
jgi:hypothetical protein